MIKEKNGSPAPAKGRKVTAKMPPVPAPPTIACVECAETIPAGARKCSKCGSYQNWRRHVPFGQATLAVVISVIALGSSLTSGGRAIVDTASGLLVAPNTRLGIAVVAADENGARVFVSNPTSRNIVVKDIGCGLNIPIDPDQMNRGLLSTQREESSLSEIMLHEKETIGVFLVSYDVNESVVLPPEGRVLIEGKTRHITPPLRTGRAPANDLPEKVGSYCTVSGVDEANEFSVGAVALPVDSVLGLDVVTFLNRADFTPPQQADKDKLLSQVAAIRTANRSARDGGEPN
jgi:predicted nucleic acid-binding Zn ribbon protein